jgi:hypothetical protein
VVANVDDGRARVGLVDLDATLTELGVSGVFTPGSPLSNITEWLEGALDARETQPTT